MTPAAWRTVAQYATAAVAVVLVLLACAVGVMQ